MDILDYLNTSRPERCAVFYVTETYAEGLEIAEKVNEVMATGEEEADIFDKLSNAFNTAIQGMSDLLDYFENVLKKCVNSIAIMIVTSFVLPLLTLFLFRWLLNELFGWNLPRQPINIRLTGKKKADGETTFKLEDKGDEA